MLCNNKSVVRKLHDIVFLKIIALKTVLHDRGCPLREIRCTSPVPGQIIRIRNLINVVISDNISVRNKCEKKHTIIEKKRSLFVNIIKIII